MWKSFKTIVLLEIKQSVRSPGELFNPLIFFVVTATLLPFAIGKNQESLSSVGPGFIWVLAMLTLFLSFDKLFRHDDEAGAIDHWLLAPLPPSLIIMAKVLANWLLCGLPLCLLSPLLGLVFGIKGKALVVLVKSLLLGTPTLSLLGAIGATLTVGLRGGHLLVAVIVLPWSIPILILGAGSVTYALADLPVAGLLEWLASGLALALGLTPLALVALLRVSVSAR